MKVTVVKLKTVALIAFAAWSISSFAQDKTVMYVMKDGEVVFQSRVLDIDTVTFDEVASDDNHALVIQNNDGSSTNEILLNDIQQLIFSGENLTVEKLNGSDAYAFKNTVMLRIIEKTGINNPPTQSVDVQVYVTPAGDVIVESPVAIKLLTLFGIDGKMISNQHCNGVEIQCIVSLQNDAAGIYLLRVETEQGSVVKKVVKLFNK